MNASIGDHIPINLYLDWYFDESWKIYVIVVIDICIDILPSITSNDIVIMAKTLTEYCINFQLIKSLEKMTVDWKCCKVYERMSLFKILEKTLPEIP